MKFTVIILLSFLIKLTSNTNILTPVDYIIEENLEKLIKRLFLMENILILCNINCEIVKRIGNDTYNVSDINLNQPRVLFNGNLIGTNTNINYFTNMIIIVRDFQMFLCDIKRVSLLNIWNRSESPKGKYLIININFNNVEGIFKTLWKMNIHRILMYETYNTSDVVVTANPYLGHIQLEKYDINDVKFVNYLPEHLPITFRRGYNYAPFDGDEYMNVIGLSDIAFNLISKTLKFNLSHVYFNLPDKSQFEYDRTHNTRMTNSTLTNGLIDIIIVHDPFLHYYDNYDLTENLFTDKHIFAFNKPGPKNNIEIIVSIFAWSSLLMIIIILLITTELIWQLINGEYFVRHQSRISCFILLLSATLNMGIKIPSRKKIVKTLIIFYFSYSLHINYYFQGRLSSLITNPPLKRDIRNELDLFDSDLIPMIGSRRYELIKNEDSVILKKLFRRFAIYSVIDNRINFIIKNPKYASTAYKSIYYLYANNNLKEIDCSYPQIREIRFGLLKGHPLTERLNEVIRRIVSAGLPNKWLYDMKTITFITEIDNTQIVLTFYHLFAAFFILIGGLLISIAIFISELLIVWFKKTSR